MIASWLALLLVALVPRGAGLVGHVRTGPDSPVAGAILVVQQGQHVFTATANERGEFSLPDVELPAFVEVRASGFATVRQQVTASPATITLTPAMIRESILVKGCQLLLDAIQLTFGLVDILVIPLDLSRLLQPARQLCRSHFVNRGIGD